MVDSTNTSRNPVVIAAIISGAAAMASAVAAGLMQDEPEKRKLDYQNPNVGAVRSNPVSANMFGGRADIGQGIPRSSLAQQLLAGK